MMKRRIAACLAVGALIAAGPALYGQERANAKPDSFGPGRIIRADGTKILVSSFTIESGAGRVAYAEKRLKGSLGAGSSSLDLSKVRMLQVRKPPTAGGVVQAALLAGVGGGIVCLLASNSKGGPQKETWPAIGAGTVACAAAGAVLGLTIRRYETVYTNPGAMPKPVIKLTLGPVAPRTPGLGISVSY